MGPLVVLTEKGKGSRAAKSVASQRGIALVAVLWVILLLSLIAASISSTSRTELRIARNMIDAATVEAAADGAVYQAVAGLVAQRGFPGDWRTDGTPRDLRIGDIEVTVSIQDEGGRIDLNTANRELLENAFRAAAPGSGEALAAAVLDWRDSDDFVTPGGAEDPTYTGRGYPYGAKDAPFDSLDELRQVLGVTPQIFDRVSPLLTVYSGNRGVDPSVAPREVLLAQPQFDETIVEMILRARTDAAEDGSSTAVGPPITTLTGQFSRTKRNAFAITAVAQSKTDTVFIREAVAYLTGGRDRLYSFLWWGKGRR